MSDSVWVKTADDVFVPDENFLDTVKTAYDAEVFGAPFDETTCRDINRLVEQETDGMITEILDQIPELAVMYLVNAVAFDAEWETPYDESQIQDATFYAEDGSGQEVSMMYDTTYRYLTMEHAEGFCRAYKEGYDFVALLPEEGLSLSEWLEELDGETFHETIRQENDTMIETGLPQFTGETDLELKDTASRRLECRSRLMRNRRIFPKWGTARTEEISASAGCYTRPTSMWTGLERKPERPRLWRCARRRQWLNSRSALF